MLKIPSPFIKRVGGLCLLLGLFLGLSFFSYKHFSKPTVEEEKKTTVVVVKKVQKQAIQQVADFIGFIEAEQQTTLIAKAPGSLRIFKESGESVAKGSLIAKIENQNVDHNYKLLKEAEALAQLQFDRWAALEKHGAVSKNAVSDKKNLLLEAQKRLSDGKISMEELKFSAPFKGTVGIFKMRDGAQIQSGDAILSFYDPSSLRIVFDIPLSIAGQVKDGDDVLVKGQLYPLTHIQKMLDPETHMCPAFVRIQCDDCIIGASTSLGVVIEKKENATVVPFGAIFLKEGKSSVYLMRDNKALLTPVTLGIRSKEQVEVTSGLQEGDPLIVEGHALLYPEAPVVASGSSP